MLLYAVEIVRRFPAGLAAEHLASKLTCTLSKEMFFNEHVQEFRDYLVQLLYALHSLQERGMSEDQIKKEELDNFVIEI